MSEVVLVALISGPVTVGAFKLVALLISWLRHRRKDDAEADLTTGQTWQAIVGELRGDIKSLRDRVGVLETDLTRERERSKGLAAEVDRYKQIGRSLLRHVLRLREALGAAGAEVPPMPADIEDAMTYFNLP